MWGPPATGAPAGTLNTIAISSALDPRTPDTEDWPLEVSAVFPGGLARTATGIVRVRHSGSLAPGTPVESGLPGIYFKGLATIYGSAIAEPEKSAALALLDGSRLDFETGLTAAALAKLANLRTMVTPPPGLPGITPDEQTSCSPSSISWKPSWLPFRRCMARYPCRPFHGLPMERTSREPFSY